MSGWARASWAAIRSASAVAASSPDPDRERDDYRRPSLLAVDHPSHVEERLASLGRGSEFFQGMINRVITVEPVLKARDLADTGVNFDLMDRAT